MAQSAPRAASERKRQECSALSDSDPAQAPGDGDEDTEHAFP